MYTFLIFNKANEKEQKVLGLNEADAAWVPADEGMPLMFDPLELKEVGKFAWWLTRIYPIPQGWGVKSHLVDPDTGKVEGHEVKPHKASSLDVTKFDNLVQDSITLIKQLEEDGIMSTLKSFSKDR